LAAAFLLELLPLLLFPREGAADWIAQALTGAISLTGLVLAVSLLRPSQRPVNA
jgi:succinate dehydrogenase hydrophobic anchor subunit